MQTKQPLLFYYTHTHTGLESFGMKKSEDFISKNALTGRKMPYEWLEGICSWWKIQRIRVWLAISMGDYKVYSWKSKRIPMGQTKKNHHSYSAAHFFLAQILTSQHLPQPYHNWLVWLPDWDTLTQVLGQTASTTVQFHSVHGWVK